MGANATTYNFNNTTPHEVDGTGANGGPSFDFQGLTIYSGYSLNEGAKNFIPAFGRTVLDLTNSGDDNNGLVFVLPTATSSLTITYGSHDDQEASFSFVNQGMGPGQGTNGGDGYSIAPAGLGLASYTYTGAPITTFAIYTDLAASLDITSISTTSPVATPEAGSVALLGMGLLGFAAARRRRV